MGSQPTPKRDPTKIKAYSRLINNLLSANQTVSNMAG